MSSPKRYLWDEDPRRDGWRFNSVTERHEHAAYATGVEFTTLVNDWGEPLHMIPPTVPPNDDARFPSMRALYARSNLMTFALAEIFLHAFCMMNAPAHRLRRRSADLPRRLRRIIMTMPTGMPLAERQILRKRALAARDLVFLCLRLARVEPITGETGGGLVAAEGERLPDIVIEWDEASATQAAFLYSQVAVAYSGDARGFFKRARLPGNAADPAHRATTSGWPRWTSAAAPRTSSSPATGSRARAPTSPCSPSRSCARASASPATTSCSRSCSSTCWSRSAAS